MILLSLLFDSSSGSEMSFVVGPYQDTFGFDSHCSAQWVVGTLSAYSAVGKAESGV